jgi:hypothetical protein
MVHAVPDTARARLDHKAVLLDTDLVIKSFLFPELRDSVFPILHEVSAIPTLTPEIRFEFLRTASFSELYDKRQQFIQEWPVLDVRPGDREQAILIGRMYKSYGLAPSMTDCISAAMLKKFPARLFLVTLNHKDFPPFLFERVHAAVIDAKSHKGFWETLVWGIYAFDEQRYVPEAERLARLRPG